MLTWDGFVRRAGTSPNALDENSYSPLHAAASWGQSDILRYLVEKGGDINLTDSDGETPLFVVETVGMAKLVVELGGDPKVKNEEGLTVRSFRCPALAPLLTFGHFPLSPQHHCKKTTPPSLCTSAP